MKQELMTVIGQKPLTHDIFEMTLEGEMVNEMHRPDQFLHVLVPGSSLILRRPISIAEILPEANRCRLIYRVVGEGTRLFSRLKAGDRLDVLGPLGNGYPLENVAPGSRALLLGGGIGIPPLYETAKQLSGKGVEVTCVFGFRSAAEMFYLEEFARYGTVHVATDDGSCGVKGTILDAFRPLEGYVPDAVFACGPTGMLRAVQTHFPYEIPVYLSLEERMACGIGACAGCTVQSSRSEAELWKVCEDGPVFEAKEVVL